MNVIYNFILGLFNITPNPYRFSAFQGAMMIVWFLLASIVVFFPVFFIILAFQKRNPLSSNFNITLPFSLTLTTFLAFLASFIFTIIQMSYFDWEYFDLFKSDFLLSILPFSFFLLLTISFLLWYRVRRKHKVKGESSPEESKGEV